jgi:hypothetical protein
MLRTFAKTAPIDGLLRLPKSANACLRADFSRRNRLSLPEACGSPADAFGREFTSMPGPLSHS